jgi:hypothetical protein
LQKEDFQIIIIIIIIITSYLQLATAQEKLDGLNILPIKGNIITKFEYKYLISNFAF